MVKEDRKEKPPYGVKKRKYPRKKIRERKAIIQQLNPGIKNTSGNQRGIGG